jgi:hypothetical protein
MQALVSKLEAIGAHRQDVRNGRHELIAGSLADERRSADPTSHASLVRDASMMAVEDGIALVALVAACLLALARG